MSDAKKLALLAEKLKRGQHLPEPRDAPYRDGSNAGVATEASFSVDLQSHQVIAKPKSVQDVVSCLCEARAIGSSVSVVGGNHSGYGRSGDLVLEMSHFNWVQAGQEPAPEQQTEKGDLPSLLHIGAGVTLKDVAVEAEHLGLAVALGTAPTVGLGLVLQGGVGHLTRKLGLSMDRIHSLQLVTAAEVLNLSSESEGTELKELFWAAVGCAPNFGVVTSVTLKAVPFQPCDSFRQVFEFKPRKDSKEDEVPLHSSLQKYLSWSSELPVDCSADCCLHFVRYFKDATAFGGDHSDEWSERSCSILMGIYTFDFGCTFSQFELGEPPLFQKLLEKHGLAELMDHEPYLCEQPAGTVHKGFIPKRSFFVRALFFEKSADISKDVMEGIKAAPSAHCYFHFQHMGGVVSERKDSIFAARQAEWSLVISAVWSDEKSADACRSWAMQVVQNLLPKAIGSYATDLGPGDEALAKYSFGENTVELIELKKRWDPENMFRHGFPLAALKS